MTKEQIEQEIASFEKAFPNVDKFSFNSEISLYMAYAFQTGISAYNEKWVGWLAAKQDLLNNPTEPTYTPLKDGEIADIVNKLRDTARMYHDTQQLRAQIHEVIVPVLKGERR